MTVTGAMRLTSGLRGLSADKWQDRSLTQLVNSIGHVIVPLGISLVASTVADRVSLTCI